MKIKRIVEIEDNCEGMSLEEALHDLNDCVYPVAGGKSVAFAVEILRALTESKPYDDSGDLISREALKEDLAKEIKTNDLGLWLKILSVIDNVQAVEPDRPQGEWIIDGHHRRCNKCGEYFCIADSEGNEIPSNFCPNCGADMRTKESEDV